MVVECSPKERLVGKTEDEEVGRDVRGRAGEWRGRRQRLRRQWRRWLW